MATQSLKGIMHQVREITRQIAALTAQVEDLGALGNLAKILKADAQGNVSITLPAGGSFAVRQGEKLRIAVDGSGNAALFGAETGFFREGGGQANLNAGGLHLNAPGGKSSIWLHPDGTITVVGDFQIDLGEAAPAPAEAAFSLATDGAEAVG